MNIIYLVLTLIFSILGFANVVIYNNYDNGLTSIIYSNSLQFIVEDAVRFNKDKTIDLKYCQLDYVEFSIHCEIYYTVEFVSSFLISKKSQKCSGTIDLLLNKNDNEVKEPYDIKNIFFLDNKKQYTGIAGKVRYSDLRKIGESSNKLNDQW